MACSTKKKYFKYTSAAAFCDKEMKSNNHMHVIPYECSVQQAYLRAASYEAFVFELMRYESQCTYQVIEKHP